MKQTLFLLILIFGLTGCSSVKLSSDIQVLPAEQVNWEKLNPARGDKSPQAATLWCDRKGEVETGFLVKFVDGFSSPPHIHNVTYRGIVISGLIHNDDPKAANMWMPTGSYWTQPAGEVHITSAKGKENIAFIEIDKGPYLVKPRNKKFDNGERPYNIHASNVIWKNKRKFSKVAVWKKADGTVSGRLYKFDRKAKAKGSRAIVIQGSVMAKGNETILSPGSLIKANAGKMKFRCESVPCLVYVKN